MTRKFALLMSAAGLALSLSLSACGGGGGSHPEVIPPPPPPPPSPPPPPIIEAATTSQVFAGKGATITEAPIAGDPGTFTIADNAQLQVRYDAANGNYEVRLPSTSEWLVLAPGQSATDYQTAGPNPVYLGLVGDPAASYRYSALAYWSHPADGDVGALAFGIPTPSGAVPVTGSANYSGVIAGRSTEFAYDYLAGTSFAGSVQGSISLAFNFGAGSLSGSISPTVFTSDLLSLGTIAFTNTVYSSGSNVFSGKFDTDVSGENAFSGLFTGPAAQELIGNFVLPYRSTNDDKIYQATGAFAGKSN